MPCLQRYPLKLCVLKYVCFFKLFIFLCWFSVKETCTMHISAHFLLIKSKKEIVRNKHFSSQENGAILNSFYQNKVSRVLL